MRAMTVLLALLLVCLFASAAEEPAPAVKSSSTTRVATRSAEAKLDSVSFKAEHPGDTALSQDEQGKWQIRSFPGLATLYVYDKDTLGTSNCGAPCTSAWAPLLASSIETEPVGDWTLIARSNGQQQWAYKGQPVYLRYHNLPPHRGNIRDEGFRKLEP
jgi:predicted lipoprotein with Yx(FWY)xxD motif